MIIGPAGAGKTTLSLELGQKLNLPVYHVDRLFFQEGWRERPTEEFIRHHLETLTEPKWIIDGNAARHFSPRAKAAQLLIYLNFSRTLCLYHMIRRWWTYRKGARPDRPDNCPERINWKLIRYIWNYNKKYRPQILALLEINPNLTFLEFCHPKQVKSWMNQQ